MSSLKFLSMSNMYGPEEDAFKTDSETSSQSSRGSSPILRRLSESDAESDAEIDSFFCDERLNFQLPPNKVKGPHRLEIFTEIAPKVTPMDSIPEKLTPCSIARQRTPKTPHEELNYKACHFQPSTFGPQQARSQPSITSYQHSSQDRVVSYQHPSNSTGSPADSVEVYVVAFKSSSRDFILGTRVPTVIAVGDAVIVSVEKGEDLGIVSRILSMKQFVMERFHSSVPPPQFNINRYVGCILRAATPREVRMLSMKAGDENEVLEYARHLACNVYRLPLLVHDVEYQFDRHKITIYYEAQGRVDYRNLVQDVCGTFKARVWMERVNF